MCVSVYFLRGAGAGAVTPVVPEEDEGRTRAELQPPALMYVAEEPTALMHLSPLDGKREVTMSGCIWKLGMLICVSGLIPFVIFTHYLPHLWRCLLSFPYL